MTTSPEQPRRQPAVLVHFSLPDRRYEPQQQFSVQYAVEGVAGLDLLAVERSVLWYTEGKGEEDIGVHVFERLAPPAAGRPVEGEFTCRLPASPLSYEGLIVKIRWCVRVRLFWGRGKQLHVDRGFQLISRDR